MGFSAQPSEPYLNSNEVFTSVINYNEPPAVRHPLRHHLLIGPSQAYPSNTIPNTGLLPAHRRRRWANITPALGQRLLGYLQEIRSSDRLCNPPGNSSGLIRGVGGWGGGGVSFIFCEMVYNWHPIVMCCSLACR